MTNDAQQTHDGAQPLLTPRRKWDGAVRAFAPWRTDFTVECAPPDTSVQITSSVIADIDLVLTFSPPDSGSATGIRRVSAFQKVSSSVRIDFTQQAMLFWMASVQQWSSMSPNQMGYPYTRNSDEFTLKITREISLIHDTDGWKVPHYDPSEYSVNVGFGLKIGDWVYWGFSVLCNPDQEPVRIDAGSYELFRSNGAEQIGDPVALDQSQWDMPIGSSYQLAFDAWGNGTLTKLDE
jgi:hypothetical protein